MDLLRQPQRPPRRRGRREEVWTELAPAYITPPPYTPQTALEGQEAAVERLVALLLERDIDFNRVVATLEEIASAVVFDTYGYVYMSPGDRRSRELRLEALTGLVDHYFSSLILQVREALRRKSAQYQSPLDRARRVGTAMRVLAQAIGVARHKLVHATYGLLQLNAPEESAHAMATGFGYVPIRRRQ